MNLYMMLVLLLRIFIRFRTKTEICHIPTRTYDINLLFNVKGVCMKWFANRPLGVKLGLVFALVFVLVLAENIFVYLQLQSMNSRNNEIIERWQPAAFYAAEMNKHTADLRILEWRHISAETDSARYALEQQMSAVMGTMSEHQRKFELLIASEDEKKLYKEFSDMLKEYLFLRDEMLKLSHAGLRVDAVAILESMSQDLYMKSSAKLRQVVELSNAGSNKAATDSVTISSTTITIIMIANAMMLCIVVIVAFFTVKGISVPIRLLQNAAGEVAAGNTDIKVDIDTTDETGKLAESFSMMVNNIRTMMMTLEREKQYVQDNVTLMLRSVEQFAEGDLTKRLTATQNDDIARLFNGYNNALQRMSNMIENIIESVNSTAAASRRIMEGAETMAQGIQKQASDTTMIAAAVEQMASTIADNSLQAHHAVDEAESAVVQARQGGAVVQQTIHRINSIASVVKESASTIERLGDSTTEIGSAAQMIEDIADQTNLLALNAAIEAARAGDQGRGFAVVADEVRKLAERTQDATHEIAAIIKRIQTDSRSAVVAIDQGTKEVIAGQQEAEQAAKALDDILIRIEGMSERITGMAGASEELASTAQSIAQTVDTIRDVAETATATTSEIAHEAEQLYSMTEHLHALTEQFHVERQNNNHKQLRS